MPIDKIKDNVVCCKYCGDSYTTLYRVRDKDGKKKIPAEYTCARCKNLDKPKEIW